MPARPEPNLKLLACPYCHRRGGVQQGLAYSFKTGTPLRQRACAFCAATWSPCEYRVRRVGENQPSQCGDPANDTYGSRCLCRTHFRRVARRVWSP